MPLEPGDPAPDVTAPNQHGESTSPRFDSPTVLYFYPEDGTPGCQTEATQFQFELEHYQDAGVAVYGISTDPIERHREFAEEHDLEFDLLADPDGDLADAFDLDLEQGRYPRTTFVFVDGQVDRVYEHVTPDGHARDLMFDLLDDGVVELEGL